MSSRETDTRANGRVREARPEREARESEQQKLRRLQAMMELVLASIAQDRTMTVDEAAQLAANAKKAALRMFPDRESAFNLLCRPRIQRAMRERFQIQ